MVEICLEYGDGKIVLLNQPWRHSKIGPLCSSISKIQEHYFLQMQQKSSVDKADYIKENLQSQAQEYRASYATTTRTVWGNVGKRLKGIPVTIVNRHDNTMRNVHRQNLQLPFYVTFSLKS